MAEAKTREQLEADWWSAWWRADFSWEGLESKTVGEHGGLHGEKTLREYWRRDQATGALRDDDAMWAAGELADCDGTVFHIAHLPPKTKSGAETWKAKPENTNWNRLDALLAQRIDASLETKVKSIDTVIGTVEGPDGRAQFAGAVLRGALFHPKGDESALHLEASRTATLGLADYGGRRFGPGAGFNGATFSGDAYFNSATFSGDAHFNSAIFSGVAYFKGATFSGEAGFNTAIFSGATYFQDVTFSGEAGFNSATFSGDARFFHATLSGEAVFLGVTFSGDALFNTVTFSGDAHFHGVTFSREADFLFATFSGKAGFDRATFSGDARFLGVTFSGDALFNTVTFSGNADFDQATFQRNMEFEVAVFEGSTFFKSITWPADARHWHGAFDAARFRSMPLFAGSGFRALAAFDRASLERGIQFDDPGEASAGDRFRLERKAAIEAAKRDGADFKNAVKDWRKEQDKVAARSVTGEEVRDNERGQRERRLNQLEGGCRVLKQAMGGASDKSREQMFYRFELLARRKRRGLRRGERFFSLLYGLASDYGASMARPLGWLAVLIGLFGVGFFFWAYTLGLVGTGDRRIDVITAAWQAFDLSWANVFKPLFALSADARAEGTLGDRLLGATPWVAFAVRAAATIQSLLAIVLAFLFVLAVRRRFQIS